MSLTLDGRESPLPFSWVLGVDQENSGGLQIHSLGPLMINSLPEYFCFSKCLHFVSLPVTQAWVLEGDKDLNVGTLNVGDYKRGVRQGVHTFMVYRQISLWFIQIKFFQVLGLRASTNLNGIIFFHLIYKQNNRGFSGVFSSSAWVVNHMVG